VKPPVGWLLGPEKQENCEGEKDRKLFPPAW